MRIGNRPSRVLWYVSLGFGLIILLSWLEELAGLSYLVFGGQDHASDWRDAAMQTLLIVIVWAVVLFATRQLVAHLVYLKGFLRVCSWCRKVGYKDKWLPLEKYFAEGLHVGTTHGMCPECFKKLKEDTAQLRREEIEHHYKSKDACSHHETPT
jgi:hypothetical protein